MSSANKFETGKKYKNRYNKKIYDCLWSGRTTVVLTTDFNGEDREFAVEQSCFLFYDEYVEPRTVTGYLIIVAVSDTELRASHTVFNCRDAAEKTGRETYPRGFVGVVEFTYTEPLK